MIECYHNNPLNINLLNLNVGPTQFYNFIHNPNRTDQYLIEFRAIICDLTRLVLESYEWSDIQLDYDFRKVLYLPKTDCVRFTFSDQIRIEILDRLSRLNRLRYEEEVKQGFHGNTTSQMFTNADNKNYSFNERQSINLIGLPLR